MECEDRFIAFMRKFVTRDILNDIEYSDKVEDSKIEMRYAFKRLKMMFRWVLLPRNHPLFLLDPEETHFRRPFKEEEWRSLGIRMSLGWYHCGFSPFEPNVLIFKRNKVL